jgi:hypothetical protein
MVGHDLQRSGVALKTRLAEDLPLVPGERVQLRQVVLNLILMRSKRHVRSTAVPARCGSRHPSRMATRCTCRSAIRARAWGWRRIRGPGCSMRSTRRSRVESAWDSRSASRSSRRMAARSARRRILLTARSSNSGCPLCPTRASHDGCHARAIGEAGRLRCRRRRLVRDAVEDLLQCVGLEVRLFGSPRELLRVGALTRRAASSLASGCRSKAV